MHAEAGDAAARHEGVMTPREAADRPVVTAGEDEWRAGKVRLAGNDLHGRWRQPQRGRSTLLARLAANAPDVAVEVVPAQIGQLRAPLPGEQRHAHKGTIDVVAGLGRFPDAPQLVVVQDAS